MAEGGRGGERGVQILLNRHSHHVLVRASVQVCWSRPLSTRPPSLLPAFLFYASPSFMWGWSQLLSALFSCLPFCFPPCMTGYTAVRLRTLCVCARVWWQRETERKRGKEKGGGELTVYFHTYLFYIVLLRLRNFKNPMKYFYAPAQFMFYRTQQNSLVLIWPTVGQKIRLWEVVGCRVNLSILGNDTKLSWSDLTDHPLQRGRSWIASQLTQDQSRGTLEQVARSLGLTCGNKQPFNHTCRQLTQPKYLWMVGGTQREPMYKRGRTWKLHTKRMMDSRKTVQ